MKLSKELKKKVLKAQKNEITEYILYEKLAKCIKGENNKTVLEKISADELRHYLFFKKLTSKEVKPSMFLVWFYYIISRLFGLNFGVKLMEKGEQLTQSSYAELEEIDHGIKRIKKEEERHEMKLLNLLDKKGLQYTSSIVLGLNDALVELTGVLAGLTLALQQTKIVAIAGLITGIAASLSMGASEYLSKKDEGLKDPFKSSLYTGFAYIIAVLFLVIPYFILSNPLVSLGVAIAFSVIIIFMFTFYISVAKGLSFKKRFLEMVAITLGVAVVNFFIGLLIRRFLHIDI